MHFGLGGRQCIGKTIAQTNIYKVLSTLLREFEFEYVGTDIEKVDDEKGRKRPAQNKLPEMISVGISDLQYPLIVRARKRAAS